MRSCGYRWQSVLLLVALLPAGIVNSQQRENEGQQIQISDQPTGVDPATLVTQKLAQEITVQFQEAGLSEVADWIQENAGVPVLFDKAALNRVNIPLSEPVSDSVEDAPLYLLLNRLSTLGLSWYIIDEVVLITSESEAQKLQVTVPYPVDDLRDNGFRLDDLRSVLAQGIAGDWDCEDGSLIFLGDVLFVRQTHAAQLRVKGLLAALRKHGSQTFVFDPSIHPSIRERLAERVSVDFNNAPLVDVTKELSEQAKLDIRLDRAALLQKQIRVRTPVTFALSERRLSTVLDTMLASLKMTWHLQDGVVWLTTLEKASAARDVTAVYDVRDLCQTFEESEALAEAIVPQTGGDWVRNQGEGGSLTFAKPGTMVVRNSERIHAKVLSLLRAYRTALKSSKPRKNVDPDDEIVVRYYHLESKIVEPIGQYLKSSVVADSWQSEQNPKGIGVIKAVLPAGLYVDRGLYRKDSSLNVAPVVKDRTVLVIEQSRRNHQKIAEVLNYVTEGDDRPVFNGFGGGGFGGGSFGSGFFSIETQKAKDH